MKQLVTKGAYIVKTGNEWRWEWDGNISLPCESFDKCLVWLLVARSGCRTTDIMPLTQAVIRAIGNAPEYTHSQKGGPNSVLLGENNELGYLDFGGEYRGFAKNTACYPRQNIEAALLDALVVKNIGFNLDSSTTLSVMLGYVQEYC